MRQLPFRVAGSRLIDIDLIAVRLEVKRFNGRDIETAVIPQSLGFVLDGHPVFPVRTIDDEFIVRQEVFRPRTGVADELYTDDLLGVNCPSIGFGGEIPLQQLFSCLLGRGRIVAMTTEIIVFYGNAVNNRQVDPIHSLLEFPGVGIFKRPCVTL